MGWSSKDTVSVFCDCIDTAAILTPTWGLEDCSHCAWNLGLKTAM